MRATTDSRTKVAGEVEEQLTKVADDRKVTASDMPTDLMALYADCESADGYSRDGCGRTIEWGTDDVLCGDCRSDHQPRPAAKPKPRRRRGGWPVNKLR